MRSPFSSRQPSSSGRTWYLGVLLALVASSCTPEVPVSPARGVHGLVNSSEAISSSAISQQFVVTLAPGVDPEELARDYGAVVVSAAAGFATLRFTGNLALSDSSPAA